MILKANIYSNILSKFPQQFAFCFAYGSGVKKQLGYDSSSSDDIMNGNQLLERMEKCSSPSSSMIIDHQTKHLNTNVKLKDDGKEKMIDLLFCVNDSLSWHNENIQMNPSHYSALRFGGGSLITRIQQNYGAKCYCNTLIPIIDNGGQQLIKYNVISKSDLINDLLHWKNLYIAGRLHKPIDVVHLTDSATDNETLRNALHVNFKNAIHTALLLLPERFTFYQLFYQISNLSYAGDFRMIFGETKDKVKNIVQPQIKDFYQLYLSILKCDFRNSLNISNNNVLSLDNFQNFHIIQEKSPEMIINHLQQLPKGILRQLIDGTNRKQGKQPQHQQQQQQHNIDVDPLNRLAKDTKNLELLLVKSINKIVWNSSVYQSIKNIPTAGLIKSIRYSWKKALKTFNM